MSIRENFFTVRDSHWNFLQEILVGVMQAVKVFNERDTDYDQVDDEDADVVDDNAELHQDTPECTKRIAHQAAIRPCP